jgi:hypothetical protein
MKNIFSELYFVDTSLVPDLFMPILFYLFLRGCFITCYLLERIEKRDCSDNNMMILGFCLAQDQTEAT